MQQLLADRMPAPGPAEPLFVPYPENFGLEPLFVNARKSENNPGGIEDGMTLVVSEPKAHDDESIETTWQRIGDEHAKLMQTREYQIAPGPLDTHFFREHWTEPQAEEQLVAPTSERTPAGIERHIASIVLHNEHHIPEDTATHIGLRGPHIGSGGRYKEPIWGWDNYFDAVGLAATKDGQRVRNAAENMAAMVDRSGLLSNSGLRVIADRPHQPFVGHMVDKLASIEGPSVRQEFLPTILQNWVTWTAGRAKLADLPKGTTGMNGFSFRTEDGGFLEGVGSTGHTPRAEMYREDLMMAHQRAKAKHLSGAAYEHEMELFYDHIRGGAIMGNDFHGGQCADGVNLHSIDTVGRMSVSINSLLAHDELMMAAIYAEIGDMEMAEYFYDNGHQRVRAMDTTLFNQKNKTYQDRYIDGRWAEPDANMAYPLYAGVANDEYAEGVRVALEDYVRDGGVVTTLNEANHNWGGLTDWAMTAHVVIRGVARYGHAADGERAERALTLAERAWRGFLHGSLVSYMETGQVSERVNAIAPDAPNEVAGLGQYDNIGNFPTRGLVYQAHARINPRDPTGGVLPFRYTIRNEFRRAA